jgi:hypothetical protein
MLSHPSPAKVFETFGMLQPANIINELVGTLKQYLSNKCRLHTEVESVSFLSRAKIVYQGVAEVN